MSPSFPPWCSTGYSGSLCKQVSGNCNARADDATSLLSLLTAGQPARSLELSIDTSLVVGAQTTRPSQVIRSKTPCPRKRNTGEVEGGTAPTPSSASTLLISSEWPTVLSLCLQWSNPPTPSHGVPFLYDNDTEHPTRAASRVDGSVLSSLLVSDDIRVGGGAFLC